MDSLKLFKIEAVIVDDGLTKEEVAKRLGSFIISMELNELDPTTFAKKQVVESSKPAAKPVAKKKTSKKSTVKPTRHRNRAISTKVQARIDLIKNIIGDREMTIEAIVNVAPLNYDQVIHALLIGEQKRVFACKLLKVKAGVRPLRHFSVIK